MSPEQEFVSRLNKGYMGLYKQEPSPYFNSLIAGCIKSIRRQLASGLVHFSVIRSGVSCQKIMRGKVGISAVTAEAGQDPLRGVILPGRQVKSVLLILRSLNIGSGIEALMRGFGTETGTLVS